MAATGLDADEAFDEPRELTDWELSEFSFVEEDDRVCESFRECLDRLAESYKATGKGLPCFFATTDF